MPKDKIKISNSMLGVISIVAIVLIVYFAINFRAQSIITTAIPFDQSDSVGQANLVFSDYVDVQGSLCKIIVGMTTVYDDNTLAVSLEATGSSTYSDNLISVKSINSQGCLIDVNGVSEYIAVGQIQRVDTVYITVKSVVN